MCHLRFKASITNTQSTQKCLIVLLTGIVLLIVLRTL